MDTEKVKQLADNIKQLIALYKEHEETVKELIRLTLRFLPGSKTYVSDRYQQQQRKQLIEALEDYINQGDSHVKS